VAAPPVTISPLFEAPENAPIARSYGTSVPDWYRQVGDYAGRPGAVISRIEIPQCSSLL
jgi:hypothetical protein